MLSAALLPTATPDLDKVKENEKITGLVVLRNDVSSVQLVEISLLKSIYFVAKDIMVTDTILTII